MFYELFFVNDRYVKSNILSSAVEEAYKPFLMLHKFPFIILYLDIPSELLDVNVHPAKTVIRFMDEMNIYDMVRNTVSDGIRKRELIPQIEPAVINTKADRFETTRKEDKYNSIPEPFETKKSLEYRKIAQKETASDPVLKESSQMTLFGDGFLSEENIMKHRIIGQVFDTYWLIEYEKKLYIVDQHAAHEKVIYERLSAQIAKNSVISQLLSPPYIMSLSQAQADTLSEYMSIFEKMGFTIEHFGGREYALSSVPAELFGMSETDYILNVLDDLAAGQKVRDPEQIRDRIATMACKAAVKGNMRMSVGEADALIGQLLKLDNPYNCPHGRPTVISFSESDLEKMFKRIV